MSATFAIPERITYESIKEFVERVATAPNATVRLEAKAGRLSASSVLLAPTSLNDPTPTVLVGHGWAIGMEDGFEAAVVPARSLRERLRRFESLQNPLYPQTLELPLPVPSITWNSIVLPDSSWRDVGEVSSSPLLAASARAGLTLDEIDAKEFSREEAVLAKALVWGGEAADALYLPAGTGLALAILRVPEDETLRVQESGPWSRVLPADGEVLVHRDNWRMRG